MLKKNIKNYVVNEDINKRDEEKIKKIVSDTFEEFFKIMWQRKNFWQSGMKK